MAKKSKKFYAVAIGRSPGVFRSWDECEMQVTGFRGAIFKSFPTEQEALDYVEQHRKMTVDIDWEQTRSSGTVQSTRRPFESSSSIVPELDSIPTSTNRDGLPPPIKKAKLTEGSSLHNPFTDSTTDLSFFVSFDGGSRGNPGVAGSGAHVIRSRVVFLDPPQESRTRTVARSTIRLHRFLQGSQTNNQAEYWGLISGLEYVYEQLQLQFKKEQQQQVPGIRTLSLTIQGDSKLVVQQMNGAWKVGNILQSAHTTARTCLKRIEDLCKVHGVVLTYTLSHVYRTDNKAADECANLAMDSQRSWATSIDSDGEETRADLSDVIPGS